MRASLEYIERLIARGSDAQERGDYAAAERFFREAVARDDSPFQRIYLARLFDATGNDRAALEQYRKVMYVPPSQGRSTMQDDPRLLVRFGDLCAKTGSAAEARETYRRAIERSTYGGTPEYPKIVARNASFNALRAAAHLAWAMKSGVTDDAETQGRELETAVKADPSNWTVRFYRARFLSRSGKQEEASREASLALRLAPPQGKACVETMMQVRGLSRVRLASVARPEPSEPKKP